MEEGAMEQKLKDDNSVNEEYLDTHEMNYSSPMDNLELVPLDLDCPIVTSYPCITDIEKSFFPIYDGLFIETCVLRILLICFPLLTMSMLCNIFKILILCMIKKIMLIISLKENK